MKRFLFAALLATVAVGGAFAGNANTSKLITTAKPFGSNMPCNQTVACHPSPVSSCIILGVTYGTTNPQTGLCTRSLAADTF